MGLKLTSPPLNMNTYKTEVGIIVDVMRTFLSGDEYVQWDEEAGQLEIRTNSAETLQLIVDVAKPLVQRNLLSDPARPVFASFEQKFATYSINKGKATWKAVGDKFHIVGYDFVLNLDIPKTWNHGDRLVALDLYQDHVDLHNEQAPPMAEIIQCWIKYLTPGDQVLFMQTDGHEHNAITLVHPRTEAALPVSEFQMHTSSYWYNYPDAVSFSKGKAEYIKANMDKVIAYAQNGNLDLPDLLEPDEIAGWCKITPYAQEEWFDVEGETDFKEHWSDLHWENFKPTIVKHMHTFSTAEFQKIIVATVNPDAELFKATCETIELVTDLPVFAFVSAHKVKSYKYNRTTGAYMSESGPHIWRHPDIVNPTPPVVIAPNAPKPIRTIKLNRH